MEGRKCIQSTHELRRTQTRKGGGVIMASICLSAENRVTLSQYSKSDSEPEANHFKPLQRLMVMEIGSYECIVCRVDRIEIFYRLPRSRSDRRRLIDAGADLMCICHTIMENRLHRSSDPFSCQPEPRILLLQTLFFASCIRS